MGIYKWWKDVRVIIKIQFRDETRQEYWFDSAWKKKASGMKDPNQGKARFYRYSGLYHLWPGLCYDKSFGGKRQYEPGNYAVGGRLTTQVRRCLYPAYQPCKKLYWYKEAILITYTWPRISYLQPGAVILQSAPRENGRLNGKVKVIIIRRVRIAAICGRQWYHRMKFPISITRIGVL